MNRVLREILREVAAAVGPIVLTVLLLNLTLVPTTWERFAGFLVGSVFVFIGFTFFLVGVRFGLVPLGEFIGSSLPERGSLVLLLVVGFLIGFVVAVAEPHVRVLAHLVASVDPSIPSTTLIYTVALGVGLLVVVSMLRVLKEIPVVHILLPLYGLIFLLSYWVSPDLFAVAFDSGGVTTGPVTVPFILALNVGIVSVLGSRDRLGGSFGLLALVAVGPVLAILLLSFLR